MFRGCIEYYVSFVQKITLLYEWQSQEFLLVLKNYPPFSSLCVVNTKCDKYITCSSSLWVWLSCTFIGTIYPLEIPVTAIVSNKQCHYHWEGSDNVPPPPTSVNGEEIAPLFPHPSPFHDPMKSPPLILLYVIIIKFLSYQ